MEKDEPKLLYHFTKMETALEYILPNWSLRLGPIVNTNDPRENRIISFTSHKLPDELNCPGKQMKWQEGISKSIRENVKVLCFSTDDSEHVGWNSPRMWAQYGGYNKGLCLVINWEKFKNQNKMNFEKKEKLKADYVDYLPPLPSLTHLSFDYPKFIEDKSRYLDDFRKGHYKNLFFSKHDDWKGESEYRLVYFDNTPNDCFLNLKGSIEKIILGIDFHKSYRPSIFKLSEEIPVHQIKYSANRYSIEPPLRLKP